MGPMRIGYGPEAPSIVGLHGLQWVAPPYGSTVHKRVKNTEKTFTNEQGKVRGAATKSYG